MAEAREGQRGDAWIAKDRGEAGYISMLVWRHVTPRWADNPVCRHVVGGGVGSGEFCLPQKYIRRQ